MIDMTEAAAGQVLHLLTRSEKPQQGVRISVKGGGCSGLSYQIDLESQERKGDKVFETKGIKIFIDLKSLLYLKGTMLDFQDQGISGKRFTFVNPNAKKTCGCGESFAI